MNIILAKLMNRLLDLIFLDLVKKLNKGQFLMHYKMILEIKNNFLLAYTLITNLGRLILQAIKVLVTFTLQ